MRHIIGDAVAFHQVPVREMQAIKAGADFVKPDGTVIANERLTRPADPSMSYAYCSDTVFSEAVARAVEGVDVLYHEATYLDAEREKAHMRFHSTAAEAARVAQSCDSGRRTHYRPRTQSHRDSFRCHSPCRDAGDYRGRIDTGRQIYARRHTLCHRRAMPYVCRRYRLESDTQGGVRCLG